MNSDSVINGCAELLPPSNASSILPSSTPMTEDIVPQSQNVKQQRVPYVNLFKHNRMAKDDHKLEFHAPGTNRLKFTFDDIDTVEQTYGICLLGYIISGKPPTNALVDLVRRWGKDVKFQTHSSGWIVFKFPSIVDRDRILNAGPYMV